MMLGRLNGTLVAKQPAWAILDIQGVGYEIHLPLSIYVNLPELNSQVTLWIHQVIREDANLLYGFAQLEERQLFRELIKVNGVGPKVGMAIMSSLDSSSLLNAIQNKDLATLTRIPGIGKKTGELLLLDLTDRLKDWGTGTNATTNTNSSTAPQPNPRFEAEEALIALGYKPTAASRALAKLTSPDLSTQELIKAALQNLAS